MKLTGFYNSLYENKKSAASTYFKDANRSIFSAARYIIASRHPYHK
jgi:hypothetical protein